MIKNRYIRLLFLAMACCIAICSFIFGADGWKREADLIQARAYHTATLLNDGTVLVAGGVGSGKTLSSCEIFDPKKNYWRLVGQLSDARWNHASILLPDGRVLAVGGNGTRYEFLRSYEVYDPKLGEWKRIGQLSQLMCDLSLSIIDSTHVLVVGSWCSNKPPYWVNPEVIDLATGSSKIISQGELSLGKSVAVHLSDAQVLVCQMKENDIYEYAKGTWSKSPSLTDDEPLFASKLPGGRVVLLRRTNTEYIQASVSPPGGSFTNLVGSMVPDYRSYAVLFESKLILIGKEYPCDSQFSCGLNHMWYSVRDRIMHLPEDDVRIIDLENGQRSVGPSLRRFRTACTATLLNDHRILVVGGVSGASRADDLATVWDLPSFKSCESIAVEELK